MPDRWRLLVFLLCLALAGGCSRREAKLTFAVGGTPAELQVWEAIIADFQRQSGVSVELQLQPTDSDQRRQLLVIPLAARRPDPDVFLMDVVWLAQFAASDWLLPLDERLRRAAMSEDLFFSPVMHLVDHYQGRLVALPVYIDAGLLYYRQDLLAHYGFVAPPTTWEELLTQARAVQIGERNKQPRFTGFVWQGAQYEGLICNFLEFAAPNGGGLVAGNGSLAIDTPENRLALQFMVDLIHRYRVSPLNTYSEMREEECREYFQDGLALFERNWPYAWALHQGSGSPVAGKVGIAPLPHFAHGRSAAALGGWQVGISRFSDVPEAAWQLVKYLTSFATQKRLALELGWNPGRRDLYTDPEVLAKYPHFAELRQIFEQAVPRPVIPYYTQVSAVFQRHLNAALAGRASPSAALRAAQQEAKAVAEHYEE